MQSALKNNCGIKLSLKKEQMSGTDKLSLTERQFRNFNEAKMSNKGVKLNLSVNAIKEIAKTGGIFPPLAALPAIIATAAPAVANAVVLGAVGTAAGMALKKATGHGIKSSQKREGV